MGEATYYAKIYFKDHDTAEKALAPISEFISEGQKAYKWWQENRDTHAGIFWQMFETKFPLITEYLKHARLFGKDNNNGLAEHLNFGYNSEPFTNGAEIRFSECVWHFADWGGWLSFVKDKFNARQVRYVSDEYTHPFDLI